MVKITSDNVLNILLVCARYVFSDVRTEFVDIWILRLGGLTKFLHPIRVMRVCEIIGGVYTERTAY